MTFANVKIRDCLIKEVDLQRVLNCKDDSMGAKIRIVIQQVDRRLGKALGRREIAINEAIRVESGNFPVETRLGLTVDRKMEATAGLNAAALVFPISSSLCY